MWCVHWGVYGMICDLHCVCVVWHMCYSVCVVLCQCWCVWYGMWVMEWVWCCVWVVVCLWFDVWVVVLCVVFCMCSVGFGVLVVWCFSVVLIVLV